MNKLDSLLSIVDNLELKSNSLLQGFQDSHSTLDQVLSNNNHISTFDIKIDNTNRLLQNNCKFTAEFNELMSKASLFEHNFLNNDLITNNNAFNNISNEFSYLKLKFGIDTSLNENSMPNYNINSEGDKKDPGIPKLNSVSDLSLKPIRCKSQRVYKKKSRYRISNIFNNPILNSPVVSNEPSSKTASSQSQMNNSMNNSNSLDNDSSENIMDLSYPQSNDTTPDMLDINQKPFMAEIGSDDGPELLPNQLDYDNDNDSVISFDNDFNFEQYLRKSRINLSQDSYPYVMRKSISDSSINAHMHANEPDEEYPHDLSTSSIEEKSNIQVPKTNFNFKFHNPIDNVKPSHEFLTPTIQSIYSTTMTQSPKSDLSNALSEQLCSDVYSSCTYKSNHNDAIDTSNYEEPISSMNDDSYKLSRSGSISDSVFGSESFLSKVMRASGSPSTSMKAKPKSELLSTPKEAKQKSSSKHNHDLESETSPFSFFKFISSSPDKTRGSRQDKTVFFERNNGPSSSPLIGRSLTEGFFQLMQSEPSNPLPPKLNSTPILTQSNFEHGDSKEPINPRKKKRNKLNELKSIPKSTPILIQTDNHLKRLPPQVNNGSSSSLTLHSNKSFTVDHGDSSIFKKPIIQRFSSRSLQEALSTSLLPY